MTFSFYLILIVMLLITLQTEVSFEITDALSSPALPIETNKNF